MAVIEAGFGDLPVSRKDFLRFGVGAGLGLLAGGSAVASYERYKVFLPGRVPNPTGFKQFLEFSYQPLMITKDAHFRSEPRIPPRSRFYFKDIILPWDQIQTINGADVTSKDAIVVLNAPIVLGSNVDGNSDSYFGDRWASLQVNQKGKQYDGTYYVSTGLAALNDVESWYLEVGNLPHHPLVLVDGKLRPSDYDGLTLPFDQTGITFALTDRRTAARAVAPQLFAADMLPKLKGETALLPPYTDPQTGEKVLLEQRYNTVQVVAAGSSLDERAQMVAAGTPVNVRDYPGTYHFNGEPTTILGEIKQGAFIDNVIVTPERWGTFLFSSLSTNDFKPDAALRRSLDPDQVCTVEYSYLSKFK